MPSSVVVFVLSVMVMTYQKVNSYALVPPSVLLQHNQLVNQVHSLTMRTFHIGGTASGLSEQSFFVAKYDGIVEWRGIRVVKSATGQYIVISRKARMLILAPDGRELQRHDVEYGATAFSRRWSRNKSWH